MKKLTLNQAQNLKGGICTSFPGNTDQDPFGTCFNTCLFAASMSGGNVLFACTL